MSEPILPLQMTMIAAPEYVRARVAWHEVGHVVVAKLLGARVESVTLHADGTGMTRVFGAKRALLRSRLGGYLNERLFLPPREWRIERAAADIEAAAALAVDIISGLYRAAGRVPSQERLAQRADFMLELDEEDMKGPLAANVIVSRTIFGPLMNFDSLDETQVLELFAEGIARQAEDDKKTGRHNEKSIRRSQ